MDAGVKARWILLSVILILFSSFEDSEAGGIPSFCNIPPVKEGGNATVTCTFTEDIFVTKSDFEIDRYSSTNKQETLLVCNWIIHKLTCNLNSRITFDHVITNTFQIQIPNVTSADAGKYICYVLPAPNGISKSCNLILEETTFISETHAPGYQLPRSSDLPMIDIWTTIQDSKEDGIMSASVMGILIAVIIALIILQGIICMAGFIYFKRRLRVWTNDNDKEANKGQTKDIKKKTNEKKDIKIQKNENINTSYVSKSTTEEQQPLSGIEQNKDIKIQKNENINTSYVSKSTTEEQQPLSGIEQNKDIKIQKNENINTSYVSKSTTEEQQPLSGIDQNESTTEEQQPLSGIEQNKSTTEEQQPLLGIDQNERGYNTEFEIMERLPLAMRTSSNDFSIASGNGPRMLGWNTKVEIMEILPLAMRTSSNDFSIASGNGPMMLGCNTKVEIMEILPLAMRTSSNDFSIASGNGPMMDIKTQKKENVNTSCVSKSTAEEQQPLSGIE